MRLQISKLIIVKQPETWPPELYRFLENNMDIILESEYGIGGMTSARKYDELVYKTRDILRKFSLLGFHCTKLTDNEVSNVSIQGMTLQNKETLCSRIDSLLTQSLISNQVAIRLKSKNQANDSNRAKMIWFCFFEPYIAGEGGIGCFFKYWGGEALYNSHEDNADTSAALLKIGTPCIVEAEVPMRYLSEHHLPEREIYRIYLGAKGYAITESIDHEGFSLNNLSPNLIQRVIKYPESRFIELTKCNEWYTKI